MDDYRCPKCGSDEIDKKHCFSSIYGALNEIVTDFCMRCGFKSAEPFDRINFRISRDVKIEKILKKGKDGI